VTHDAVVQQVTNLYTNVKRGGTVSADIPEALPLGRFRLKSRRPMRASIRLSIERTTISAKVN